MPKLWKSSEYHTLMVIVIFFTIWLFNAQPSYTQWPVMKTDADSLVLAGADYIYNIEFDRAEQCFKQVIEKYPLAPAGYFLDAMVEWWKIAVYRESQQFDEIFLKKIDRVIEICDAILDTNEFEIGALFFKGGALGYRGRFHVLRGNWFRAATDGYKAFQILIKCLNIAPNNYDIMLGTGIYNYFAEAFPEQNPSIKPLMAFVPKGDKKIGILQLEAASKNARYAKIEAKFVLLQIYYDFEKNAYSALPIAEELARMYPANPVFQRYLGRCYVSSFMLEAWQEQWQKILENYRQRKAGFDLQTAREALYYLGSALMEKNQLDDALKYFYKCDEVCRIIDRDGPSPFMIYLNLKIGKIYDIQGKRKYAIEQYNKVLSWKNYRDSHEQAKKYLQVPFSK